VTTVSACNEDELYGAGLAALGASPGMLRKFLDGYGAREAWEAIARGRHRADPGRRWRTKAVPQLLDAVGESCAQAGVSVMILGQPGYPPALADDGQAPAVLFGLGEVATLEGKPRVAVVGTRSATPYGLGVATELGRDLTSSGVVVVSGGSLGIDAAAHGGALGVDGGTATVAVLGTALDAPASRSQSALRVALGQRGTVLSEIPPGAHSARWWFAVRNRVIAALAHVVVVVECHHGGGSLNTVSAALARGVTVTAVPGSIRSPASAGTNRLLVEGAAPVRDVDDVLTAVELPVVGHCDITPPRRPPARPRPPRPGATTRLGARASRVARALDQDPATLDVVVRRSGLGLGEVSLALEELSDAGLAVGERGWWSRPRS